MRNDARLPAERACPIYRWSTRDAVPTRTTILRAKSWIPVLYFGSRIWNTLTSLMHRFTLLFLLYYTYCIKLCLSKPTYRGLVGMINAHHPPSCHSSLYVLST